jgi:hypothetical protein
MRGNSTFTMNYTLLNPGGSTSPHTQFLKHMMDFQRVTSIYTTDATTLSDYIEETKISGYTFIALLKNGNPVIKCEPKEFAKLIRLFCK